ncbi:hypothetical protein DL93DRAFT_2079409 [Clavulina sp. PMI_390]|nr:hypothetical protein DL93DRAFT_2079409 [Clavulina sp. PMI_390]
MSSKILTIGPVQGAYSTLVTKVKAIDAKHGKFDMVLCLGDFFGLGEDRELDDLLQGNVAFTIPTYIMQGPHPIPQKVLEKTALNGGEICSNVFILEKSGIITTSSKLTIGTFGGVFSSDSFSSSSSPADMSVATYNNSNLSSFLASSSLPAISTATTSTSSQPSLASLKSAKASQIDILLTNQWPVSITRQSKTAPSPANITPQSTAPPLDDVVRACRPRYHFACAGGETEDTPIFWEREPYVWENDGMGELVSRFISLGSLGASLDPNAKKQRWFYAFSITPYSAAAAAAITKPANATPSPFQSSGGFRGAKRSTMGDQGDGSEAPNFIFGEVKSKRPRLAGQKEAFKQDGRPNANVGDGEKPPEGYVCKICQSTEHFIKNCPDNVKNAKGDTGGRKPPPGYVCRACGSAGHLIQDCPTAASSRGGRNEARGPVKDLTPDECWFCLSNPKLTKHLIVSIGTEIYVTLPKGQLPPTSSPSPTSVPGGGHVLLIPIPHFPTLATLPPSSASIHAELAAVKSALARFYAAHGAVPVFFELARMSGGRGGAGGHALVQCVPVPEEKKGEVEGAFKAYGGGQVVWEKDPEGALQNIEKMVKDGVAGGYFRADLPDGRMMLHLLKQGRPFNLQFGREALAQMLDVADRADWKACSQTEDEEKQDAQAFKEAFAEFDPSLL